MRQFIGRAPSGRGPRVHPSWSTRVRFAALAAFLAASPTSATAKTADFGPRAAAAIEAAAKRQIQNGAAPAFAIQVVRDGKVVFSRAYGVANLEWNTPATPDTVFRIASNTKAFTAASVLILADRKLLSIDDQVSKYLPEFPRSNEVTLRMLLNHTSGLSSYDESYHGRPELAVPHSTDEMIDLIRTLKPLYAFEPGTGFKYSNSGYYLLGAIVEKVSGQRLGDFMTENIFAPLGMANTAMDEPGDIVPRRAAGYEKDPARPGSFRNAPIVPYTSPGPAGGLRSTVVDLARWYEALFGGRVVGAASLQEMLAPGRLADGRLSSESVWTGSVLRAMPDAPYQYGFGIRSSRFAGHREYWHSGAIEGFTSQVRTYPDDKVTVALLSNGFRSLDGLTDVVVREALGVETGS